MFRPSWGGDKGSSSRGGAMAFAAVGLVSSPKPDVHIHPFPSPCKSRLTTANSLPSQPIRAASLLSAGGGHKATDNACCARLQGVSLRTASMHAIPPTPPSNVLQQTS